MEKLSETKREVLKASIKDISDTMAKIDLHRESIKEMISAISEEHDLDKKQIRKLAKVYHKDLFQKEVSEMNTFEGLYNELFFLKKNE